VLPPQRGQLDTSQLGVEAHVAQSRPWHGYAALLLEAPHPTTEPRTTNAMPILRRLTTMRASNPRSEESRPEYIFPSESGLRAPDIDVMLLSNQRRNVPARCCSFRPKNSPKARGGSNHLLVADAYYHLQRYSDALKEVTHARRGRERAARAAASGTN